MFPLIGMVLNVAHSLLLVVFRELLKLDITHPFNHSFLLEFEHV